MNKKLLIVPFIGLLLTSCGNATEWTIEDFQKSDDVSIKNVILMVSDGTSKNTVNIARDVNGGHLYIDEFMNGSVKTASLTTLSYASKTEQDANPTDSAAAATAMATGFKTTNRSIGMVDGEAKTSVLKKAKEKGLRTGLVTTVGLLDATPAAFYAHTQERSTYDDVYASLLSSNIEVLMGDVDINGAQDTYYNEADFTNLGYTTAVTKQEFDNTPSSTNKFIANFNERYDVNRRDNPSFNEYVQKALDILSFENDDGFFAMFEGGAIDHANHNYLAYESITDFLAFDKAVKTVTDFAKSRNDTAVIICPDHGNGAIKYIKGHDKYNPDEMDLYEFLIDNTEYTIHGHTNEDVYLASYVPNGVSRIGGKSQFVDNTTIAHYIDALLELQLF